MLVAAVVIAYLLVPLTCVIMAGGNSWFEPTLESMPDRVSFARWLPPARFDLN